MNTKIVFLVFSLLSCLQVAAQDTMAIRNGSRHAEPLYYLDSIPIMKEGLKNLQPQDIASISVFKDTNAIALFGTAAANGVVWIETKKFVRTRYWRFFSTRSADYARVVPSPESEENIVYILNGKVLSKSHEAELAKVKAYNFRQLTVIGREDLQKSYHISDKEFGIVIQTKR